MGVFTDVVFCFARAGFGAGGGANSKHVKDQSNDMVKNSITLGKDIHTESMKA